MDAKTCLQKLQYVGVLAFATVDEYGAPQVRNINAIHYEPEAIYFFTAKGKNFCRQLLSDGRVQILGYTKYKEMIRLSAKAKPSCEADQQKWIDTIFEEQPYLSNVYPDNTRKLAGIVFEITDACISCGSCLRQCPQGCIEPGTPYQIQQEHCLHCGNCQAACPVQAVEIRMGHAAHDDP